MSASDRLECPELFSSYAVLARQIDPQHRPPSLSRARPYWEVTLAAPSLVTRSGDVDVPTESKHETVVVDRLSLREEPGYQATLPPALAEDVPDRLRRVLKEVEAHVRMTLLP